MILYLNSFEFVVKTVCVYFLEYIKKNETLYFELLSKFYRFCQYTV